MEQNKNLEHIICKYLDDKISLDDNYTLDELYALAWLDAQKDFYLRIFIDSRVDHTSKIELSSKNIYDDLSFLFKIAVRKGRSSFKLDDNIELHDIIKSKRGKNRLVFRIKGCLSSYAYICQLQYIDYYEDIKKYCIYYQHCRLFYMDESYLITDQNRVYVSTCYYDDVINKLVVDNVPIYRDNFRQLKFYRFDNTNNAQKALKVYKNNKSLFHKLYNDNIYR